MYDQEAERIADIFVSFRRSYPVNLNHPLVAMTNRRPFSSRSFLSFLPFFSISLLSIAFAACTEGDATLRDIGPPPSPPEIAADSAKTYRFGDSIQQWIAARDTLSLAKVTDLETLLKRVLHPDSLQGAEGERMNSVLTNPQTYRKNAIGLWGEEGMHEGREWRLLTIRSEGKGRSLIFRAMTPEGTLDYVELLLSENPPGNLLVCDWRSFTSGEFLSRQMAQAISADRRTDFERLLDLNDEWERTVDIIREAERLAKEGRPQEGLELLQRIPQPYRQMRGVQAAMLDVKSEAYDARTYRKSIDLFVKKFGDSPEVNLLLIDRYGLAEDYSRQMEAINRIDAVVRDPYLDAQRAECLAAMGKMEQAEERLRAVLAYDSSLVRPNRFAFLFHAFKPDFPEAEQHLRRLAKANVSWPELPEILKEEGFEEFTSAPEYRNLVPLVEKLATR